MIHQTLSCTARLQRPGCTRGPLYHYVRLFTVKCLVWMRCGVEFSSPHRTWSLHILRLCACLTSLEMMSFGARYVSFDDFSRVFKPIVWFHNICEKWTMWKFQFLYTVSLASRYQPLRCGNSCAYTVFPLKFLMLVGSFGWLVLPSLWYGNHSDSVTYKQCMVLRKKTFWGTFHRCIQIIFYNKLN